MEAVWDTEKGVPLTIIGWPDEEKMVTKYATRKAATQHKLDILSLFSYATVMTYFF